MRMWIFILTRLLSIIVISNALAITIKAFDPLTGTLGFFGLSFLILSDGYFDRNFLTSKSQNDTIDKKENENV